MKMAATASSSSSLHKTGAGGPKINVLKQLKNHEVAVAELNDLTSSRDVYQKNGNLFFRTTIQRAMAMEQKQLDSVQAMLKIKILNSSS